MNRKLRHVRQLMAVPYLLSRNRDARELIQDDVRRSLMPIDLRGWWNKLYLFKPGTLEGRVLYMDLDTVIIGDLDPLAEYDGRFAILCDLLRPHYYGSGVMMWDAAQNGDVWERYVRAGCPNLRRGDQAWMQRVRPDADVLQDLYPSMFVSYKAHCSDGLPDGASVVCYHGTPRPHEVESEWMDEHWYGLDA